MAVHPCLLVIGSPHNTPGGSPADGYTEKGLKAGDKTTFKVVVGAAENDDSCSLQFMSFPTGHYALHDEVVITVADTT